MGRARPFVCTLECVGMEIRWTARTRARGTVDCSSVVCARSTACRSGPHGTVDCSSVRLRACDCDCTSARVRLRLHVAWAWETWAWKRRLCTSDCLSVRPAWENSPVSSVLVRLRLHDAWAWEAWAWKRHGAADGTSARAWDELDLVRLVCLAALDRVVLVDVE